MAQVPYSPVPTVATEANPQPFSSVNPTAADFGGKFASAVEETGQKITQIGQEQNRMALELQAQHNTTLFNDTTTAMSEDIGKLDNEFRSLHGNNAVAQLPEFQQRLDQIREKYAKSMQAPVLQRAFNDKWNEFRSTTNRSFGAHAANQADDAYIKSLQAKGDAAVDRLVRNSGLGGADPDYDDIIDSAVALGTKMGWDKATTDTYVQSKATDAVKGIVIARIASGHLAEAQSVFDAAAKANVPGTDVPMLDGTALAQLSNHIKTEIKTQQNLQRAEYAQDAQGLMQSDIQSRMMTGQPISQVGQDTIRLGLTPKQYEAYQAKVKLADMVFKATGDLSTKTDAEIIQTVNNLLPQGGGDDYADRMQTYKVAKSMADQAIAIRRADPASAVLKNFQPVQYAFETYRRSPNDPGSAQQFVKKSLAAQESLGLYGTQQKALPKAMADGIAAEISNPNAQAAAASIAKYENVFGKYWDDVFRQVNPKMDPAVKVASTMTDQAARTILIDASRRPKADLLKLTGTKEADLANYIISDPTFSDYFSSMRPYGGNSSAVTDMATAVQTLALGYMVSKGVDVGTAVNSAITDTLGHYRFANVNGQAFMTPDTVDPKAAETSGRNLLNRIDTKQIDMPPDVDPGVPLRDRQVSWERQIRENGQWVTAPGMTGVQLYVNGAQMTRYGRPITYTWEQLLSGEGMTSEPIVNAPVARKHIPAARRQ